MIWFNLIGFLLFFLFIIGLTTAIYYFILRVKVINPLREQNLRFTATYNAMPDLVFCKNANGFLIDCNDNYARFFGKNKTEIIGKTFEQFSDNLNSIQRSYETDAAVFTEQKEITVKLWLTNANGERRLFSIIKAPIMQQNKIIGLTGVAHDITEHDTAEKTAQKASKAKSVFIARMSHEIRTPMNTVFGMTELVLRDQLPAATQEKIAIIRQSSKNLLSIINDILDYSKIESGNMEIVPSEYQLAALVSDVINIIKMRMHDSRLRFIVDADGNIPNTLYGDSVRIRQIILYLLSNAIKYTEHGFVSLSFNGKMMDDQVHLIIEVKDSGIGIKEEDHDKVFGEFVQFNTGSGKESEGTGLGLTITRDLVKNMEGEISFRSQYGSGSLFKVVVPQRIMRYDKLASVKAPKEKHVLIYERRDAHATSITRTMESLNVDFYLVSDDEDFLSNIGSDEFNFIFIATHLYSRLIKTHGKLPTDTKIILIAEFNESVEELETGILTTPIYSVPVAQILNGVYDVYTGIIDVDQVVKFTAPGARILIVDDIATNLQVAEGLMLPYNMQIDVCKSGEEAVEAVRDKSYDIIFMDHMMPGMDGVEATRLIRELGHTDIPIIALTANVVAGMKEMFLANGFNDYVAKPIDTLHLNTVLTKWVPRNKQIKVF